MINLCLEMEGMIIPEISIGFANYTSAPDCKRITSDELDGFLCVDGC